MNFKKILKDSNLNLTRKEKNDEFYTLLEDIERELKYYKDHFKDKIIYCNCDNPKYSNFWKYFYDNFKDLSLKRLVATYYSENDISYKTEYDGNEITKTELKGNGDFRSTECINILKESDIVITNPPFSLFREYMPQLIEYNKKFIIWGNINTLVNKCIFSLLKDGLFWHGIISNDVCFFKIPNHYEKWHKNYTNKMNDGNKYARLSNISVFTNLNIKEHFKKLSLTKRYYDEDDTISEDAKKLFLKYDSYDAINVDKVADIPLDYYGKIGVPITFLAKHNPKQFKIIALGIVGSIDFTSNKRMEILKKGISTGKYTNNAKGTLYRKHDPNIDKLPPAFRDCKTGELYSSIYARVIIKRKNLKE